MIRLLPAVVLALPLVFRPEDVPPAYQPWSPLDLVAAPNPVTWWKLGAQDVAACRSALARAGAAAPAIADRADGPACHVRGAVRLGGLSVARLPTVDTRCAIAARLYLWERHALQPAARAAYGMDVARIRHYSSYACRPIRTRRGMGGRMSEHATANAVDISGFRLADGRNVSIAQGWDDPRDRAFLRAARDGLCDWFNVVLSPDHNALHADHFHADMGFFATCR